MVQTPRDASPRPKTVLRLTGHATWQVRINGCTIAYYHTPHTHTQGVMQLSRYEKVRGSNTVSTAAKSSEGKLRAKSAVLV